MKIRRTLAITTVCVILGTMLAWQYKSIYNNKQNQSVQNTRLEDLKDQLIMEKNNNEKLRKRNEEISKQNLEFENAKDNLDTYEKNLKSELERTRTIAGLTNVKGKGVLITIGNSDIGIVDESDILNVLNELRASDAQAISINEERVIAMTEVREAGGYIVINGKRMLPPFEIKAIADPDKIENALKMVGGVIEKLEVLYKLKVSIEKKDNLIINKIKDDGTILKTDLLIPVK